MNAHRTFFLVMCLGLCAAGLAAAQTATSQTATFQTATVQPTAADKEQRCRNLVVERAAQPSLIFYDQFLREVARMNGRTAPKSLKLPVEDCDDHYLYIDISPARAITGLTYAPRYVHWRDLSGREVGARAAVRITDVGVASLQSYNAPAPAPKKPAAKKPAAKKGG